MLNYEFPPLGGGASPVSYEIAKGYVKLGHKVDVITMHYRDLPYFEKKDGINIYRVKCLRSKKEICHPWEQLTYLIFAYFEVKKLMKKNSYNFCHCHFIIPTGILAWILKRQYGLPYIISSHGSDVPKYNTDRFVFLHKFTGPILRKVCINANKVIALSDYLKRLIKKGIKNYDRSKLIKIPNGIDPNKFIPFKKEKIILSTGRLLPRKGFQYLIQAVSSKDLGYEVHICGDGPMMKELKKLSSESKTKIVFHGWLNNESKKYKEILGKTAIYCLVSLKENASIALLEAMSAGCAVITSNVSGCPETIGTAGIVIKPKNIIELRNALIKLTNSPKEIEEFGKKSRKRVETTYSWDKIVNEYVSLLTPPIAKNNPA